MPDISDSTPTFQYILQQPSPLDYVRVQNRKRVIDECNRLTVAVLLSRTPRQPTHDRLHQELISRKRRCLLVHMLERNVLSKLSPSQHQQAVDYLFNTVVDFDKYEILTVPEPMFDNTLDDIIHDESPINQIQSQLEQLSQSAPGSRDENRILTELFTVYIPGFVNKNLPESDEINDDPLMNDIENTEYPHAPPFKQHRTKEFIKEKLSALAQHVDSDGLLSDEQRKQLTSLLCKYEECFSLRGENLGCVNITQHEIQTTPGAPAFRERLRVYSETIQEIINKEVQKLLDEGVIVPSRSPYASNPLLVRKPDKTAEGGIKNRLCIDYRRLNSITIKDSYPLANIQTIFNRIGRSKWFTTMDLLSGFWQIMVKPEHRDKTAFITARGLFEWVVMPFGLCNAPGTFQRLMDTIILPEFRSFIETYIDDILTHSPSFEQHMQHLDTLLSILKKHNMTVKLSKCSFAKREVKFLGHIISQNEIKMNPESVEAILKWERPLPGSNRVKAIRGFLGMVGWYRKFIPHFADVAAPLVELTKKNVEWKWSDECENAFVMLRDAVTRYPVLAAADPNKDYILHTDASDVALGAILMQYDDGGDLHPIAYASKTLDTAQRNYSVTDREALALVWALEHFNTYLHTVQHSTPRMHRMVLRLQPFEVKLHYSPGDNNHAADLLSRATEYMDIKPSDNKHIYDLHGLRSHHNTPSVADLSKLNIQQSSTVIHFHGTRAHTRHRRHVKNVGEYEVEKLLERRPIEGRVGEYEYRVRWLGYTPVDDTWEPIQHLSHATEKLAEFHRNMDVVDENVNENNITTDVSTPSSSSSSTSSQRQPTIATKENHEILNTYRDGSLLFDVFPCDLCDYHAHNNTDLIIHKYSEHSIQPPSPTYQLFNHDKHMLKYMQEHDNQFKIIYDTELGSLPTPSTATHIERHFMNAYEFVKDVDDILYCVELPALRTRSKLRTQLRLCVPSLMRQQVMKEIHDGTFIKGAHPGIRHMTDRLREQVWWPRMIHDIEQYISKCSVCQQVKKNKRYELPQPMSLPYGPWSHLAIDHVGPFPITERGNTHILVCKCRFLKYAEAWAVPSTDAESTIKCLRDGVFHRYGLPIAITTDNGSGFVSSMNASLWAELNIKQITTTPYHPQSNGDVERLNGTLKSFLKLYVNEHHTDWDVLLPWALFAYNTSYHSLYHETPFYMNFGRDARTTLDIIFNTDIDTQMNRHQYSVELAHRLHDVHVRARELLKQVQEERIVNEPTLQLNVGDQVFLHSPASREKLARKFLTRFKGPYTVIEKLTPVTYTIQRDSDRLDQQTVHVSRLRKMVSDDRMDKWKNDLHLAQQELETLNQFQIQLTQRQQLTQSNIDTLTAEIQIENQHQQ
jgi:hypothetical protein